MNAKRQTVWLVSMLSLMVVLSAYYLFTEDMSESAPAETVNVEEIQIDASELDKAQADALKAAAGQSESEILKQAQAKAHSGAELISSLKSQHREALSKRVEQLSAILSDTKKTKEETAKAREEIDLLEQQEQIIDHLEDTLMADYQFADAAVVQDSGKWTVYLNEPTIEKSEVASIAVMVMKELKARPEQISVKLVN
ncbi:SpoIIIAH-like family protein [Paenibacillus thermoaerophilus]|uniref:SpoIIIAH-like family protein n=1 Tax=Paenibacillus thermoaerophilus TaxID=1215385 RepID=A0ABW2V6F6_9BACL|nr:SpoIIIAH-like family protein [Paenibacillus thermoaerophilus]